MVELKELRVEEVSLVDEGANPEANILFFKRKEEQRMAKDKPEGKDAETQTTDVEKAELQKRVAELKKALADRDAADKAAIEKAAKEKLAADNAEVAVLLERLNKRLEDHIEKAETNELLKVAAKYEILGEKVDELAATLKKAKGTELYDKIIGNLDRELAYVEKAGTFGELGKTGYGTGQVTIEKIADEIQKAEPTLSRRFAIEKAFQLHPELAR